MVEYAILFFIIGVLLALVINLKRTINHKNYKINYLIDSNEELKKEIQELKDDIKDNKVYINKLKKDINKKITIEEEVGISEIETDLFNKIETENNNIFISETNLNSKNNFVKYLKQNTKKQMLFTSVNTFSSNELEIVPINSIFTIKNENYDDIKLSSSKKTLVKNIDSIVINEISLISSTYLDYIDRVLRNARTNNTPFGGVQIIAFDDIYHNSNNYFFNSQLFKQFEIYYINDNSNEDNVYMNVLNDIKTGKMNEDTINDLNNYYKSEIKENSVRVVISKKDMNSINEENYELNEEKEYIYPADILVGEEYIKEEDYVCNFNLKLKKGIKVIMLNNDPERRWKKGTLGTISKLTKNGITVKINKKSYTVEKQTFTKYKCKYNEEEGRLEYSIDTSLMQYPMIVGYAIDIMSATNLIFDDITCDLDSRLSNNEVYSILSKINTYDGLNLLEQLNLESIKINTNIERFYEQIKK